LPLFAAYPAMALLATNIGEVGPAAAARPVAASVLLAVVFLGAAHLVLRDLRRSAFLAAWLLLLFFAYGHVELLLSTRFPLTDWTTALPIAWLALAGLGGLWATRAAPDPVNLNIVGAILLGIAIVQVAQGHSVGRSSPPPSGRTPVLDPLALPIQPPDIYYFILDSYGRADLLAEAYDFDNTPFLDELRDRGFYVAYCSQANYVRTELSLASSLNMQYLQSMDESFDPESTSRSVLWDRLKHNVVRQSLEQLGYTTVAFATGFDWNELRDADRFIAPAPFSSGPTDFEILFLQTTLARHIKELGFLDPDEIMARNYRDRFNLIFNSMDDLVAMHGPVFAHIHVIAPHPPFVFDARGNPTHPAGFWNEKRIYPASLYEKGYLNQLQYLNTKVLDAVDYLLTKSEQPPIIVLQGDHGPWLQPRDKRMWILNAYYLPGHETSLYPTISPVNTFRVVLNAYFGANYVILEDASFFSPVPHLYEFTRMPRTCPQ
jgi:hypothetical protein